MRSLSLQNKPVEMDCKKHQNYQSPCIDTIDADII